MGQGRSSKEGRGTLREKSSHTVVVAWPLRALAAEAIAKTETRDDRILVARAAKVGLREYGASSTERAPLIFCQG